MKSYVTSKGATQFMPSMEEVEDMDEACEGFCLACGEIQDRVEPDARGYTCESCGAPKVYGAGELVLMGLVH